jgi:hypothetical protein
MSKRKNYDGKVDAIVPNLNEKMIEVKIRFWTNAIAPESGKVIPKHAQASGVVSVERNKSHGIVPGNPRPFHSLLDLGATIEKILIEHQIVLHRSARMKRYTMPFGS